MQGACCCKQATRREERRRKRQSGRERERERGQRADPNPKTLPAHKEIPIRYKRFLTSGLPNQDTYATNCIWNLKETQSSGTTLRPRERPERAFRKPSVRFISHSIGQEREKQPPSAEEVPLVSWCGVIPKLIPRQTISHIEKDDKKNMNKEPEEKGQHFPLYN